MSKVITLNNDQRLEIINYKLNSIFPEKILHNKAQKKAFKKRASNFIINHETKEMRRVNTETISLQFFTEEEDTLKSAYISMVHNQLLHSCWDPMYHAIKDKAYGVTKEQIVEVINK